MQLKMANLSTNLLTNLSTSLEDLHAAEMFFGTCTSQSGTSETGFDVTCPS